MAEKVAAEKQTNGYDGNRVNAIIRKIESYHEDLMSERGSYMHTCKGIRENIGNAFEEAKAFDIPKKELKKILDKRALERKLAEIPQSLEGDERTRYDMLIDALGAFADTPLGTAATKAAKNDDDADLRPTFIKDKAKNDEAVDNAARLKAGIKPLDASSPMTH